MIAEKTMTFLYNIYK